MNSGKAQIMSMDTMGTGHEGSAQAPDAGIEGAGDVTQRKLRELEYFRDGVFVVLKELDSSEQELGDAYRMLDDAQAQLVRSSRLTALGEFAATLAHELSQPLTVIKGLSQHLLNNPCEPESATERLQLILDASNKMERVIRHIKVFSRTEEEQAAEVDINRVIYDALLIARELLRNNSITVSTDLKDVPPVQGSANRLEQVVLNIAANARDAMPEGGTFSISTSAFEREGAAFVCVSLADTGAGIPPEQLARIFEPFFTTKPRGSGTGLGLSISRKIIDEHNGEIRVESGQGAGTTFYIILPADKPRKD